jgi:hypothetical protein
MQRANVAKRQDFRRVLEQVREQLMLLRANDAATNVSDIFS